MHCSNEKEKARTGVQKVLSALEWLLLAASFGLVIYAFVCTARGKAVSIGGYSLLHVVTGSMEPTISVGDYVIVKDTPNAELKVGDIVAYYTKDPDIYGMLVIHRIKEKFDDGSFITMGDANQLPDKLTVYPEQALGRYVRRSFVFNWLASFADPRKLLLLAVAIPIFLLSIYEAGTLAKLIKMKRNLYGPVVKETKEEAVERLKKEAIEEYLAAEKDKTEGKTDSSDESFCVKKGIPDDDTESVDEKEEKKESAVKTIAEDEKDE